MKRLMRFSLLFFLASVLFSCKENDKLPTPSGIKFAKVDGKQWDASILTAYYLKSLNGKTAIGATGIDNKEKISIVFQGTESKTYSFDSAENSAAFVVGIDSYCSWESQNPGSITITKYDTIAGLISGNFIFDGAHDSVTKHITEGSFTNVPLKIQ